MSISKQYVRDFFTRTSSVKEILRKKISILKKKKPKDLDQNMQHFHSIYELQINCLDCANCCKTLSPAVTDVDISRLAKFLKIKPSRLVSEYFLLDNEGDYVFQSTPCPFLGDDNYCVVYEARPRACKEYPHTDRRRALQLLQITEKNADVCPIVFNVLLDLPYT